MMLGAQRISDLCKLLDLPSTSADQIWTVRSFAEYAHE
jgi:hypothetical protein